MVTREAMAFEHTSILHGQPVELLQNGCNMSILSMICNNMSKDILNTLQFVQIEIWQTPKQRVTVVQTATNQGICCKDCHF